MDYGGVGDIAGTLGTIPGTTTNADPNSAFPIAGDVGQLSGTGAGRYGVTPVFGQSGGVGRGIIAIWDWLNRPFTTPMSPMSIFLLIGTVLIGVLLWNLILYHLRIASEAL